MTEGTISDELFYDAQEAYGMKKDNRYGRARHGAENYLLTGKLYCGHCGGYMVGISGTSKTGEMHYYYACQKHRLEHTCEKKAIRRDVIENAVARAIMMYCLDDETIDFIVDSTIAYFKQKDHELHIEAMENELAAVQQAISNLMKAIEAGIITPTTRTRLLDLEEQQSKLSAKINTAKAERVEINRDDLIAGLQLFRTGDIKNKKFLAKLFNTFLIAVYLYDDNRLKIVFSFTGNHNSVEIPLELDNDCPDSEIVSDETEVRMSHLECRKNLGSSPSSGEAEKDDDCSDGRFVRTAPLPPTHAAELAKISKRSALQMALNGKVYDPSDIIGLLDMDKIEVSDDGSLKTDLEGLLKPIKESKAYLFKEDPAKTPPVHGATPADPGPKTPPAAGKVDGPVCL